MSEELFISMVEESSHLWNKKHSKYKDHRYKDATWEKIGQNCNMTGIV